MLRKALTAQTLGCKLSASHYGNNGGTMDGQWMEPWHRWLLSLCSWHLVPVSAFTVPSVLYSASPAIKGRITRSLGLGWPLTLQKG